MQCLDTERPSDDADFIWGGDGNDLVDGEAGDDTVLSDADGSDTLSGGAGDDIVVLQYGYSQQVFGGTGNDQIFNFGDIDASFGGTGADEFFLSADPADVDIIRIEDFNELEDFELDIRFVPLSTYAYFVP